MAQARFAWHVGVKHDIVYPQILRPLFNTMGSRTMAAVDVGANHGIFSLFLARNFQSCLSVEPIPPLAAALAKSMPAHVQVFPVALGASPQNIQLRVPVGADGTPHFALSSAANENKLTTFTGTGEIAVEVQQSTLDAICGNNNIGFVKIDVEGYELAVLAGANAVLDGRRPLFFVEIFHEYNPRYAEVFRLFRGKGYLPFKLRNDRLTPMQEAHISELGQQNIDMALSQGVDYLFVPEEKRGLLTALTVDH